MVEVLTLYIQKVKDQLSFDIIISAQTPFGAIGSGTEEGDRDDIVWSDTKMATRVT